VIAAPVVSIDNLALDFVLGAYRVSLSLAAVLIGAVSIQHRIGEQGSRDTQAPRCMVRECDC